MSHEVAHTPSGMPGLLRGLGWIGFYLSVLPVAFVSLGILTTLDRTCGPEPPGSHARGLLILLAEAILAYALIAIPTVLVLHRADRGSRGVLWKSALGLVLALGACGMGAAVLLYVGMVLLSC